MKKTLFLAAALSLAATLSAQTCVGTFGFDGFIPGQYLTNNSPLLMQYNAAGDTVRLYDKHLTLAKTLAIDNDSITLQYYGGSLDDYTGTTSRRVKVESALSAIDPESNRTNHGGIFTQTIFNNDNKFEYLKPVFSSELDTIYHHNDWDGDYIEVQNQLTYQIVNEDGTVVSTILPPSGKKFDYYCGESDVELGGFIILFDDVAYITFSITNEEGWAWYRIDRQSQSVVLVDAPNISVRPTMATRGQDITVELGDNHQTSEIQVVNTLGQVVKKVPVVAGQREVKINTSELKGMNFVGSKNIPSVKIVVK